MSAWPAAAWRGVRRCGGATSAAPCPARRPTPSAKAEHDQHHGGAPLGAEEEMHAGVLLVVQREREQREKMAVLSSHSRYFMRLPGGASGVNEIYAALFQALCCATVIRAVRAGPDRPGKALPGNLHGFATRLGLRGLQAGRAVRD